MGGYDLKINTFYVARGESSPKTYYLNQTQKFILHLLYFIPTFSLHRYKSSILTQLCTLINNSFTYWVSLIAPDFPMNRSPWSNPRTGKHKLTRPITTATSYCELLWATYRFALRILRTVWRNDMKMKADNEILNNRDSGEASFDLHPVLSQFSNPVFNPSSFQPKLTV